MKTVVWLDKLQLMINVILIFSLLCHLSDEANIVFREEPKDVLVMQGEHTQFNCSAHSANPFKNPSYFWKYNGVYVSTNPKNGFYNYGKTLFIDSVNKSLHEGKYECVAFMEEYGAIISFPAHLRVAYLSVSSDYNSTYIVKSTSSVLIKAPTIAALPEPIFEWMYINKQNGMLIHVNMDNAYLTKNGDLLFPSISKTYSTDLKLVVSHLTLPRGAQILANISVQVKGPSPVCQDPTVVFPLQERSKVVNEGQNVLLECTGVAKMCTETRVVSWLYKGIQYGGTHRMNNIRKQNEGVYTCVTKIGSRPEVGYNISITVQEKPRVMVPIPQSISVNAPMQLSYGFVLYAEKTEWYTNGEKITSTTGVFKITSDNKLHFFRPSRSQTGIYQIFSRNGAGFVVQNIDVYVETGLGSKVSGTSGNLTFVPPNSPTGLQHGSWLIQVPSVGTVYLALDRPPSCDVDDITRLSIFEGSTANGLRVKRVCNSATWKPVILPVKGPFVTLILITAQLQQSGFFIRFDVDRGGFTTTSAPTTTQPSTTTKTPTTTTTTQPTTTTQTQSHTSTPDSPSTTAMSSTNEITSRSHTDMSTTLLPTGGAREKASGDDSPVGAIVGGICGFLFLVAVLVGILCCRRRSKKSATQNQSEMQLEKGAGHDTARNTYMTRRPGAELTSPRFTVQPNGRPMPDVIPSYDAIDGKYEMGYLGQEQTDSCNETYETVGDILSRCSPGTQDIGNLAYQPRSAPKQVIGRRIASGPGKNTDSNIIIPNLSPSQNIDSLKLPGQQFQEEVYDSVADDNDYLTPVDGRSRIKSMAGRPLPSPTESASTGGPLYHTLERGSSPIAPSTYESPDEVISNMKKLDNLERIPSDRSENRYQALDDNDEPAKQGGLYESLTLERGASLSSGMAGIENKQAAIRSKDTTPVVSKSKYSDPCEPSVGQKEASGNSNHTILEERGSDAYESLAVANEAGNYQTLTLPRSTILADDDDDDKYAAI